MKKKLTELGLTDEQTKQILDVLKESYVEKATLDQSTTELNSLKQQVKDRDEQIESLKKFEGDNEELKKKLEEMETTNKTKSQEYDNTLLLERKKSAVRFALLEDEGGKPYDVSMVAGMFNLDTINLNEDGTIANGFKEQNENLREQKAFLFNTPDNNGTKKVGNTPPDGQKKKEIDTPEAFGARLAQSKLQMLGIKTEDK